MTQNTKNTRHRANQRQLKRKKEGSNRLQLPIFSSKWK